MLYSTEFIPLFERTSHFFQVSGPLLDESQVRLIVDEIKQVITASSKRKGERPKRAKAEDFDAEEGELVKEENEQEEEVFDPVCSHMNIFSFLRRFKITLNPDNVYFSVW